MYKWLIMMLFSCLSGLAAASEHQMIDTLGASPKGQFVALEEYGYKVQNHSYYVRIKIMNVWTKAYVGKAIDVELPAHRPAFLERARKEAKILAQEELQKFGISG